MPANFSLSELEQLIYNNFYLVAGQLKSKTSPSTTTVPISSEGLFTSVFTPTGPTFDVNVYLPQNATMVVHILQQLLLKSVFKM